MSALPYSSGVLTGWRASGSVVKIQDHPTRRQVIAGAMSRASEATYASWCTQDNRGPPKAIIAKSFFAKAKIGCALFLLSQKIPDAF